MIDDSGRAEPEQLHARHARVVDYLDDFAMRTPDVDAVVTDGQRLSYRELQREVDVLARALVARGIRRGDTIAVLSTPRNEFWVSFLAATAIGAVWVGLNPKFTLDECRHVVGDAQPRLLFSIAEFEGRNFGPICETLHAENDCLEEVVCLVGEMPGAHSYTEFSTLAGECDPLRYENAVKSVDRADPALLVYTSGTSGKPKGALLSHHGLAFGSELQVHHFTRVETPNTRPNNMCSFPINHVSSVADTCCVTLVSGGTLHFHERFNPDTVLECIEREAITVWGGVPTMFLMVLDHPRLRHTDFSSVELAVCGGAALPERGMTRLLELVPNVMNVYGMTETAANVVFTDPGADAEVLCNTIGRPSPLVETRIVDDDDMPCGVDDIGELQFRADFMFMGYLNQVRASRDAYTSDGWLKTGDLGYLRDDGNIALVGRKSEMYKSGGYNVYPREVELVLESHPSVEMAAVVGTPDDMYQEVGAAYVLPRAGVMDSEVDLPHELRSFCAEHLANYKVPKRFRVSRELPILPVGKIDKVELKNRLARGE